MSYVKELQECGSRSIGKHNDAAYSGCNDLYIVYREHDQAVAVEIIDRAVEKRFNGGYLFTNNI